MDKRPIYAEDVLEILDRDKAFMSDVGRIHARNAVNEAPTVKHPCQGCVYSKACGISTRTEPCEGRKTKREAMKDGKTD